jgi:hypothetical protein
MVKDGVAIDVTNASAVTDIPEWYRQIGYAEGIYGCSGKLLMGDSGQLYAITNRTTAIYIF